MCVPCIRHGLPVRIYALRTKTFSKSSLYSNAECAAFTIICLCVIINKYIARMLNRFVLHIHVYRLVRTKMYTHTSFLNAGEFKEFSSSILSHDSDSSEKILPVLTAQITNIACNSCSCFCFTRIRHNFCLSLPSLVRLTIFLFRVSCTRKNMSPNTLLLGFISR